MIGENVTVTVMEVVGNRVRIGIEAPKNIVVDREEIYLKKKRQQSCEEPTDNE
jgi:carbon storage regulator